MFTGIVEICARVKKVSHTPTGMSLTILVPSQMARTATVGSSIAVNGACLTVTKKTTSTLQFDVVPETLKRTTLGNVCVGEGVNLERALVFGARIDGHFVLGHVDGKGKVLKVKKGQKHTDCLISFPREMKPFILEKGSATVHGVSLTIGRIERGAFWVHLVHHTLLRTNLGGLEPGHSVNLEADVLIKAWLSSARDLKNTS